MWSVENFNYYPFGKSFTIITDQRAILSTEKEYRSKSFYKTRLTPWVDLLLPFNFDIEHIPGAKMGLIDYISLQSNQRQKLQTDMLCNLRLRQLTALMTGLQHFI